MSKSKAQARAILKRHAEAQKHQKPEAVTPQNQAAHTLQKRESTSPQSDDLNGWREVLSKLPLLRLDWNFLARNFLRLNAEERIAAATQYRETWLREAEKEAVEHRKNNAGRRAANNWIRTS